MWKDYSVEPFDIKNTPEYKCVWRFYDNGRERAQRSQVLKMNHIHEGLQILDEIGATDNAKRAFCLHPPIQTDITAYVEYVPFCAPAAVLLATEYRAVANAFLCRPETDNYMLTDLPTIELEEVRHMLIADKVQNYKDFLRYHASTHQRAKELDRYFVMWLTYLDVTKARFDELSTIIAT